MSQRQPPLPGVLADIARVAGEEAALRIAQTFGGTRVYIPPRPRPDHWLTQLVGQEAALAIGDELTAGIGGARIDIPLGKFSHREKPQQIVDRMLSEGKSSVRDIALAARYTERAVFYRKQRLRDRAQGDLF